MSSFDTPYGHASEKRILGKGITLYIVNTDFYIYVLKELNTKIPKTLREPSGWYPKIQANILPIEFPIYFTKKQIRKAYAYYRRKFPSVYEEIVGNSVVVIPTKHSSEERHRERFFHKNRNHYIEIAAWSHHERVPKEFVLIQTVLGGDVKNPTVYFLVKESEYLAKQNEYGFICIPGKHEERELVE